MIHKLQSGESCHECKEYYPQATLSYCTRAECEGPHFNCPAVVPKLPSHIEKYAVDIDDLIELLSTERES